jgi:hypothetical protein
MANLFGFLNSFCVGVVGLLTAWLGRKAAVTTALITIYSAVVIALWASIKLLVGTLVYSLPSGGLFEWLYIGINLALPSNFEVCVAAMLSADVAVYLYRWQLEHVIAPAAEA